MENNGIFKNKKALILGGVVLATAIGVTSFACQKNKNVETFNKQKEVETEIKEVEKENVENIAPINENINNDGLCEYKLDPLFINSSDICIEKDYICEVEVDSIFINKDNICKAELFIEEEKEIFSEVKKELSQIIENEEICKNDLFVNNDIAIDNLNITDICEYNQNDNLLNYLIYGHNDTVTTLNKIEDIKTINKTNTYLINSSDIYINMSNTKNGNNNKKIAKVIKNHSSSNTKKNGFTTYEKIFIGAIVVWGTYCIYYYFGNICNIVDYMYDSITTFLFGRRIANGRRN